MRYTLLVLAFLSTFAMAHTITYDNGDVYTVADDEFVFVAKQSELWTRQVFNNGNTNQFKKIVPWTKVDYTPPDNGTNTGMVFGSHEWCAAYVPWSEGYTFAMQAWQRYCDSNNDGVYDEDDERWEG